MSQATFFRQDCPTCGRPLQIRIAHLGKEVSCPHCKSEFLAIDPLMKPHSSFAEDMLLRRANELLAAAERATRQQRAPSSLDALS